MPRKKPARTSTPAIVAPSLPALGLPEVEASMVPETSTVSVPYLAVYTERTKAETAQDLMDAVGAVNPGQVYVRDGDDFHLVDGWPVMLMAEFRFWGDFDWNNGGRPIAATFSEAEGKAQKLKEAVVTVTAHIPPDADQEPILAVSRTLTAQTRWARDMCRAIQDSEKPRFFERMGRTSPELAGALQQLPGRFRVVGRLVTELGTSAKGFSYVSMKARTAPIDLATFQALSRHQQVFAAPLGELLEVFEQRREEVAELAD